MAKGRKTGWVSMRHRRSVSAVTVAERGERSMSAISPKKSPGLRARAFFPRTVTVACPSAMIVKIVPNSSSSVRTVPAGNVRSCTSFASFSRSRFESMEKRGTFERMSATSLWLAMGGDATPRERSRGGFDGCSGEAKDPDPADAFGHRLERLAAVRGAPDAPVAGPDRHLPRAGGDAAGVEVEGE